MTEQNSDSDVSITIIPAGVETKKPPIIHGGERKKSKRNPFTLLKVAMFLLHRSSNGKPNPVQPQLEAEAVPPTGDWKKLVGSMRPLHLQEGHPSPPPSVLPDSPKQIVEHLADDLHPSSPSSSSVSGGTMSQYASANNLQDLDESDEEDDDPDEVFDALTGDAMIDAKAEEFIAQFYDQMRKQNVVCLNRRTAKGKRI